MKLVHFLARIYRIGVAPALALWLGAPYGCRFTPSCSEYTEKAIENHGWILGGYLGLKRILCCHPWGPTSMKKDHYGS